MLLPFAVGADDAVLIFLQSASASLHRIRHGKRFLDRLFLCFQSSKSILCLAAAAP
jgi:hypothetical protein